MTKLLIYGNRKQDDEIWDISTPELEEAAFKELFRTLDGDWHVYADLKEKEPQGICEPCGKEIHRLCENKESCSCLNEECPAFKYRKSYEKRVEARWPDLYKKAKAGDFAAMKKLMTERCGYEYEEWRIDMAKRAKVSGKK